MDNNRAQKAILNIKVSFFYQLVTVISGFILPQLFIKNYGSEAYGASSSITQFLAYISLLEGGIGGVARAALYKPISSNDTDKIESILNELKHFFRIVGLIFILYVLVLAFNFKTFSGIECFDNITTIFLVFSISLSLFGQYFIGLSYAVLLNAAQRLFYVDLINSIFIIINTILVVLLVKLGHSFVFVKFITGLLFLIRPIFFKLYSDRTFNFNRTGLRDSSCLKDKWIGLGQHIAYFIHTNTDIIIITLIKDLKTVAVYSVYYMITYSIQNITSAFSSGMEAVFGDMLAKKQNKQLIDTFDFYESLISIVTICLFSSTAVMINSFIKIYTYGVTDADYYAPIFSILIVISGMIFCLRIPYQNIIIASGSFRETQWAAYGEAILNVSLTFILVWKFSLVGAVSATILAILFKFLYYAVFLKTNVLHRPLSSLIKRSSVNILNFIVCVLIGKLFIVRFSLNSYFSWVFVAAMVTFFTIIITFAINLIFYKYQVKKVIDFIRLKIIF